MADRDRITKAVYLAVDALNAELPAGVSVEKSLDAPVYGAGGKLDATQAGIHGFQFLYLTTL